MRKRGSINTYSSGVFYNLIANKELLQNEQKKKEKKEAIGKKGFIFINSCMCSVFKGHISKIWFPSGFEF